MTVNRCFRHLVTKFVHPSMMQDDRSAACFVGIGVGVYRITSANWFDDILTPYDAKFKSGRNRGA